jgi:predicted nucleic acid-binding protein
MARGIVLVDTNVIIECHRTGSWRALAGGFSVETVTDCVAETQTGAQRRRPEQRIDEAGLRESLAAVHDVDKAQQAATFTREASVAMLDAGERALWAHALGRRDAWLLCGPDKASLRVGVRLGCRERLIALETLLDRVGQRPRTALKEHYTSRWLARCLGEMVVAEWERST